ncbi:MAG TPA: Cof-type HAD-IIB family hydrolase [Reyranella sp.]|nr:Cof-type HAD-IIB family hydrolase [Reyranella sp.]
MKISALISDVDGTLVDSAKEVTDRTRHAVAELGRRGIAFAAISGRPPEGMAMLIEPLKLSTPITGFNGGVFARTDLSVIEERLLAVATTHLAIDFFERRGIDVWVFAAGNWLVRDGKGAHVDREERAVRFGPKVVKEFGAALEAAHKVVGVSDDLELMARCETEIQATLGPGASASRSQPYYLDVTHPRANKGAAVHVLAKLMQVPLGEVAVIGDGNNDIGMFEQSGLSIAMGNASDVVKSKAKLVTASNDEDGLAQAIERYLLGGAKA